MRKESSTNYANEIMLDEACPVNFTLNRIGGRWKLAILWQLLQTPLRFTALQKSLGAITQKVLTQQLKELQEDGLVEKQELNEGSFAYQLTLAGKTIEPVLQALLHWGIAHQVRKER